jgi:hypothetical protein
MLSCLGGALLFRSPTTCQRVRPVVFTNTTWLAGHIQRLHILQASHWFAPLGNGLWSGLGRDEEFNAVLSATERAANHSVLRSCTATRCHPFLPFPVGCTHGYGCFCKRCSRGPMVPWSAASSRRFPQATRRRLLTVAFEWQVHLCSRQWQRGRTSTLPMHSTATSRLRKAVTSHRTP